jgi:hypothetical protein
MPRCFNPVPAATRAQIVPTDWRMSFAFKHVTYQRLGSPLYAPVRANRRV